ncbi:hypothetical protein ACWEIK_25815 [Streptomyces sp. NPDC004673]
MDTSPPDHRTSRTLRERDGVVDAIGDAAVSLFLERGFDRVLVDDIAAPALPGLPCHDRRRPRALRRIGPG